MSDRPFDKTSAILTLLGRRTRTPHDPTHRPDEKARLQSAYRTYELVAQDEPEDASR